MDQYCIVDDASYSAATGGTKVYLWKAGGYGSTRLFPTEKDAAQGLVDYLAGPWKQVGGDNTIGPEEFRVAQYIGIMGEEELATQEVKGMVPKADLFDAVSAKTVVTNLGLVAVEPSLDFTEGYSAVLKNDYNKGMTGGNYHKVRLWVTGPKSTRRRVYFTPEDAKAGLVTYHEEDWDGQVAASHLNLSDFVIAKVKQPTGVFMPEALGKEIELVEIISAPKTFTEDDELF
jgi:hypothetical protein